MVLEEMTFSELNKLKDKPAVYYVRAGKEFFYCGKERIDIEEVSSPELDLVPENAFFRDALVENKKIRQARKDQKATGRIGRLIEEGRYYLFYFKPDAHVIFPLTVLAVGDLQKGDGDGTRS